MISSMHLTTTLRRNTVLVIACLGVQVIAGCKKASDDSPQPIVTVQAEHPEIGAISEHIVADATLAPVAQAAISPKVTAPVRAFYVQRGAKVKAGQLLAVLENRDLSAQALDNKGQYAAAQATFDLQTKAQVPEDYAKAELDVAQAKAQLHLQQEIANSRRRLFEQGAIAGRDYDTAAAAVAQAQAIYDTAENHFRSLSSVGSGATQELARGQLTSARGKYDAAEAQVSYTQIRSPISGVVTDRPLFPGETATVGTALITVMDTSVLLAKVHLSQSVAQRLKIGDNASIQVPGAEQPAVGRVILISPALDPGSTTIEVWLKVANSEGTYKAGTPVRALITGRTVARAIKIPTAAVLTADDGTKTVMSVSSGGVAHKVSVQVGITDGEDVEITHGLSGSETVVTNGAYGLSDGSRVTFGRSGTEGDEK